MSQRGTPKDSTHTSTHTFAGNHGFLWDELRPASIKKVPHRRGFGTSKTLQDLLRTEREGFEPSRVLPLHDFESCAINRALPPLHNVKKTPNDLRGPPPWSLSPDDDATNVADLLWDENPAMFLPIDLIQHQPPNVVGPKAPEAWPVDAIAAGQLATETPAPCW